MPSCRARLRAVAASQVPSSPRPTDWPSHFNRGGADKKIFLVPVRHLRRGRSGTELFLSSVRAGTAPCSFTRSEDEGREALEPAGGALKRGTMQPRCACERRGGKAGERDQFLVEGIGSGWCGVGGQGVVPGGRDQLRRES
jgi:hypothetical protein